MRRPTCYLPAPNSAVFTIDGGAALEAAQGGLPVIAVRYHTGTRQRPGAGTFYRGFLRTGRLHSLRQMAEEDFAGGRLDISG